MAGIRVLSAGHVFVQDLGRPGYGRVGLPANGASDGYSASVANILVGNNEHAPLMEITGSALSLCTEDAVLVAVTGSVEFVRVNGFRQPSWELLVLPPGAELNIPAPKSGLRTYVAFNGSLTAIRTLGSVSPDVFLGIGTPVKGGDRLELGTRFKDFIHPYLRHPIFRMGAERAVFSHDITVDVSAGPELEQYDRDALTKGVSWSVSPQSDHVGLRLLGPTPERHAKGEILSRGVPVGAVEVPPTGGLLVLLRGRLVTAGYPVVGVVTSASLDQLGQARPGDTIRFRSCHATEAARALRERQLGLEFLRRRVTSALKSLGLDQVVHYCKAEA